MRYSKVILIFLCTYFFLGFFTLADAMNTYTPPAQISCFTVPNDFINHCEGFETSYLKVANHDSNIPRTPVVLYFDGALAEEGGNNPEFYYADYNGHYYIAVLGPINSSIHAKIDDPIWVKKRGHYECSKQSGSCPIYSS